jgi:hypothetical protein
MPVSVRTSVFSLHCDPLVLGLFSFVSVCDHIIHRYSALSSYSETFFLCRFCACYPLSPTFDVFNDELSIFHIELTSIFDVFKEGGRHRITPPLLLVSVV